MATPFITRKDDFTIATVVLGVDVVVMVVVVLLLPKIKNLYYGIVYVFSVLSSNLLLS